MAARPGVSKSLVSLVMRGSPNVSEVKRAAVMAAAAELGYRPNAMAQGLVRNRSNVIGVMLSDLHNPFFTAVVDAISATARHAEYRALITTGDRSPGTEREAVETLLRLRTDGIVLAGTVIDDEAIDRLGVEVAVVLASRESTSTVVDSVVTDDVAGLRLAVDHLVALGHRSIAHISGGAGAGARNRVKGYRQAMRRHRLPPRVVAGSYTEEGGVAGVDALWSGTDPAPTAIAAPNDLAAVGVLRALELRGVAVPDDVSVVGYDDSTLAAMDHISLTTVHQHLRSMGATAVDLLVDRMDRGRTEARHVVLDPSFTVRSTTAPPPGPARRRQVGVTR